MNTTQSPYPLKLEGELDNPSRWMWLVKWVLLIPHAFALFFLWLAFGVTWIIAFFAILFTGRYPRGIFDFNVGVMRWTWRANFYGYGALGTDRYPPFALGEVPDYPARLEVDYPDGLSRGLVLIKWWLLAIPQFIAIWVIGMVASVVVFVAGLVLLFTGRYPQELFDFVMGLNRWTQRVLGYTALMTDAYPPFRFDGGAREAPALQASSPAAGLP